MSVAKQFTNILVLTLVERGLLKLHAPLAELIPGFGAFGKQQVNLFHLLTRTSGVTAAIPMVPPEVLMNIEQLVKWACDQPLESQPGERVSYSAMVAHSLMAAVCLAVDGRGRSYAQMLEEDLFQPLGMNDTSLGPRDDLLERLCPVRAAYVGLDAPFPAQRMEEFAKMLTTAGAENPAGGTIGDLHRFADMLRVGGEIEGVRLLSPAMLAFSTRNYTGDKRNTLFDMFSGTRHWEYYPANIGLGFFLRGEGNVPGIFSVLNSPRSFSGLGIGTTGFTIDPEKGLTFSFLSTGLMEDSYHFDRLARLATLVVAAIVD